MIRACSFLALSLSLVPPASAQVVAVGPFVGAVSEGFQTQPDYVLSTCVQGRVFGDRADLCTPGHDYALLTGAWHAGCMLHPPGGSSSANRFFGATGAPAEFVFDQPIERFGGKFGTPSFLPGGTVELYDAADVLLATFPLDAPSCSWAWNGWESLSGATIRRIRVTGNSTNGGLIAIDDLHVGSAGPGPGVASCFGDGSQALACPCGNSGAPGHGCENSATTGGALLVATGATSPDTIALTATGEPATAYSILLQGAGATSGVVFGDGVRCVAGWLVRIGEQAAVAGAATFPVPGAPSIPARSAASGDPIAVGSTRWYQVYYRDGNPGFCPPPAGSSFNATNAVSITW